MSDAQTTATTAPAAARDGAAGEVLLEVRDGLGRITLNRPRALNALTQDMVRAIDAALTDWAADPAVRGVLIRGAGEKGLCAGGDVVSLRSSLLAGRFAEAEEFFEPISSIHRYMKTLVDVGLGYVKLGQSATTLSGGEAQRVKLAKELARASTGKTLYILDEPTTGLHFDDTRKLLEVLHSLVDQGNTVVVIEHNLDVIKTADWIIDIGPEGGDGGGEIVAEGTPEEVAGIEASHTGRYLAPMLAAAEGRRVATAKPAARKRKSAA